MHDNASDPARGRLIVLKNLPIMLYCFKNDLLCSITCKLLAVSVALSPFGLVEQVVCFFLVPVCGCKYFPNLPLTH